MKYIETQIWTLSTADRTDARRFLPLRQYCKAELGLYEGQSQAGYFITLILSYQYLCWDVELLM
jgi:hypothetical protein